jgi:uncharacterized protein
MRLLRKSVLLASALLMTTPALAQQAVAPAAPAQPASETRDADPALWVVRDADTTIYLFGTMHLLRPGLTWFDEAVADAFQASSELVVEVNMTPEVMAELGPMMQAAGTNPNGTLTSRMTPEQRTQYIAAMERLGIQYQGFEQYDGWLVALQFALGIAQRAQLNPANGADQILLAAARQRGITITSLETGPQQVGFLDSLPEGEQVAGIIQMVSDLPAAVAVFDRLGASWASGDADGTATMLTETRAFAPEQHRIMFTDRNRRWADALQARLAQPGTVFVAVGAGHLAGDDSVQAFLAQRGLTVTRVAY